MTRPTLEQAMELCLNKIRRELEKYIEELTRPDMFNSAYPGLLEIIKEMEKHAYEYVKYKSMARDLEKLGEGK